MKYSNISELRAPCLITFEDSLYQYMECSQAAFHCHSVKQPSLPTSCKLVLITSSSIPTYLHILLLSTLRLTSHFLQSEQSLITVLQFNQLPIPIIAV